MIFYESVVIQTDPADHRVHLATAILRQRGVEHAERVTGYAAGLGGGRMGCCRKISEFENLCHNCSYITANILYVITNIASGFFKFFYLFLFLIPPTNARKFMLQ